MRDIKQFLPNWFEVLFPIEVEKFIKEWLNDFTDKLIEQQVESFRKSLLTKKLELTTEIFTILSKHYDLDENRLNISFPISKRI